VTPAAKQRVYRQRYHAGEIRPPIPVSERVREALIRRAMTFDGLTRKQAEAASKDRAWIVTEVADVLEELADQWVEK